MNKLIATGLVLALFTGGALAQSAAPNPPPPPSSAGGRAAPPPGPGEAMDDAGGGAPLPPGGPHGRRPPPPPPSKSAHFRLEHGDTALDIKCADDEPMKACADIALQLLDKAQALPRP